MCSLPSLFMIKEETFSRIYSFLVNSIIENDPVVLWNIKSRTMELNILLLQNYF